MIREELSNEWFPIFKTGKHTDMSGKQWPIDEAFLDNTVTLYNRNSPEFKEAPVCVGHPTHDKPAFGWIGDLKRVGTHLYARAKDLKPEFVKAVKDGYLKYVSPKFRTDGSLRHLAVLGAEPPAVAGLADLSKVFQAAYAEAESEEEIGFVLSFAELDAYGVDAHLSGIKDILRKIKNWVIEKESVEKADGIIPEHVLEWLAHPVLVDEAGTNTLTYSENNIQEDLMVLKPKQKEEPEKAVETKVEEPAFSETDMKNPVIAGLLERITALENQTAAAQSSLTAFQVNQRNRDDAAFAEGLCQQGIIPPVLKQPLLLFMSTLPEGQEMAFAEGEPEKTPREFFKGFMGSLKPVIPLVPLSALRKTGTTPGTADNFAFSESDVKDEDRELDENATKIMETDKVDYETALRKARGAK